MTEPEEEDIELTDDENEGSGRIKVGVIFGGRSGEHEVSIVSAESVMRALDPERYDIIPIGITKDGWWMTGPDTLDIMKGRISDGVVRECLLPADPSAKSLLLISRDGEVGHEPLDVLFPVLHGSFGEDGCLQGLLEMAEIPYVGAGVPGSAIGMDKVLQKQVFRQAGLPVVDFWWCRSTRIATGLRECMIEIERRLGLPVFVKPANLGSSVGITKAADREQLAGALKNAARYDRKIIVEKAVPDAREIEVAVLGNEQAEASTPGEIIPSNEFYDYNAKYIDGASDAIIPASLPEELAQRVRGLAIEAFHAVDCEGMARVDFLLSRSSGELFLNEINTLPGFTSISMYPKLFAAEGLPYPALLDRLIELAFERQEAKEQLLRTYEPERDWHLGTGNGER
jgi:D-alanine-D-alanine ligase